MKPLRIVCIVAALAILSGCTHSLHRANAEAAYYQAQADIARAEAEAQRPIVEMVARPGEQIVLQGVERFSVYAPADDPDAVRQYQAGPNPWVQALDIVADASLAGFGIDRLAGFATEAVRNAGGNTSINNSGRMDSPGDQANRDLISGNVGRHGSDGHDVGGNQAGRDNIGQDRIDNEGRMDSDGEDVGRDQFRDIDRYNSPGDNRDGSDGPIDIDDQSGDCRDGSNCNPPDDPPEGDG